MEQPMRLVVINHVTLDGVMQGPGRPDEDTRDGFDRGGWAEAGVSDPAIGAAMGAQMAQSDGLVLGRRTYEDLLASWNAQGGPFKRSEEHTSELQSLRHLVCRLLL